jgi:hypothetical protein
MNTSTAIRNGGVRFSTEERRATINSLRDVWEGESGQVLRTPNGGPAIVVKEITAQEYKDLPPCLAVLKGTNSRFGLDPSAKSFKEDDYGIGLPAYTHLDLDVKVYLARLQSKLSEKIVITKGWVNKEYNDKIKGSPESSHLSGLVIDIQNNFNLNSDEKVEEFKTRAIAAGFRYIVIYDKHIHLDIRDIPR